MNVRAQLAARRGNAPQPPSETGRIVDLPLFDYSDHDLTPLLALPTGAMRLRDLQSAALLAIRHAQGAVLPIGVGWGKTLIGLLAGPVLSTPAARFPRIHRVIWSTETGEWADGGVEEVPDCEPVERVLYLTASGAVTQTRRAVMEMSQHWPIASRTMIRSYSDLSQPSATGLLAEWIGEPATRSLVVLDEAHSLKHQDAARTKRFLRAWVACPGARYVVASGTLWSRSLRDGATLAGVALGEMSPVPRSHHHLAAWCDWIDDGAIPDPGSWYRIEPLVKRFGPRSGTKQERARRAFAERLRHCPGVVASGEGALDVSLRIKLLAKPKLPKAVADAYEALIATGERPDGEVLEDDLAEARILRQIACGFWYRWDWGADGPDRPWLDARREWHRQLRAELRTRSAEGYDSPLLVTNDLRRREQAGERTGALGRALAEWEHERSRRPQPPPNVPVWISTFLVENAADWLMRQGCGALLWYGSRAVAVALAAAGVRVVRSGEEPPVDSDEPRALSIRAHGVGLNLQRWNRQRIIEPPSLAETWEQLLGRTHRPGQQANEVHAEVYTHAKVMRDAWHGAVRNATMLEHATGNRQKLCYADIEEA